MRRLLFLLPLIGLAGCQQALVAKQAVDTVFATGVSAYCRLPEPARLANRERIAAKIFPHRIEIHCFEGSPTGG